MLLMINNHEHEDLELDSLLKQVAENHRPELPSPGLIWWRAQIQRKQREKVRIERPVVLMYRLAAIVCAAVALAMLAANRAVFQSALAEGYGWFILLGGLAVAIAAFSMMVILWPKQSKAN